MNFRVRPFIALTMMATIETAAGCHSSTPHRAASESAARNINPLQSCGVVSVPASDPTPPLIDSSHSIGGAPFVATSFAGIPNTAKVDVRGEVTDSEGVGDIVVSVEETTNCAFP